MKCKGCPVAGECVGERPGLGFACGMAARTDVERAWIVMASGAAPVPPAPAVPSPPVPTPPADSLVPLAEVLRAFRLGGRNCLYADPPSCGCTGLARCHRLGRDCTIHDCLDCLGT